MTVRSAQDVGPLAELARPFQVRLVWYMTAQMRSHFVFRALGRQSLRTRILDADRPVLLDPSDDIWQMKISEQQFDALRLVSPDIKGKGGWSGRRRRRILGLGTSRRGQGRLSCRGRCEQCLPRRAGQGVPRRPRPERDDPQSLSARGV